MFGLEFIFGLAGQVFQWYMMFCAMQALLKWISLGVVLIIAWMSIKLLGNMLELLKTVFANSILRMVVGGCLMLGLGFIMGCSSGKKGPKYKMEQIQVQKQDSMTRSKGFVIDGKIYYPAPFINKHLEKKGINEHFKETP